MARPILRRREDRILLTHQIVVYTLYALLFTSFSRLPWRGKALSFAVAVLLSQKYEAALHYSVHTPVFRSKRLNYLHRLSWFLFPPPTVLYRADHFHHHRYNNTSSDLTTTLDETGQRHASVGQYVWSSLITRKFGCFYAQLSPRQQRECQLGFALFVALEGILCLLDPFAGLLFWIPMTCVVAPVVMDLHCYTDHVPGNPYDALHCATYFDVRTRWHRLCSRLDLHNAAYHLTHHRFPGVHWSDLPRVQAVWLDEYKRHGSPVSVGFGSGLLLNPLAFLWSLWRVNATRRSVPVQPIAVHTKPTQEASWTL